MGKAPPQFLWLDGPMAAVAFLAIARTPNPAGGALPLPASLRSSLWSSLRSSLDASLGPRSDARGTLRSAMNIFYQTAFDTNYANVWLAHYQAAESIGTKYDSSIDDYRQDMEIIATECFMMLPFDGLCVVVDRPTTCRMEPSGPNDRMRLHAEDGPALEFADGWKVWSWHGLQIPGDLIEKRNELTTDSIMAMTNAEQRRVAIEIYGVDRFMPDAGGVVVQQDRYGKLWRRDLGADEEPYCAVEVLNGSLEPDGTRKTYFLAVPERNDRRRPIKTALSAVAWTYGLTPAEYRQLAVRT
ncbi:MAG: hypothetical protein LCH61_09635 [Proteobacteria bacterium]|nr:hypothetical protein [Pseudomonadota bacterium]